MRKLRQQAASRGGKSGLRVDAVCPEIWPMATHPDRREPDVIVKRYPTMMEIILNRPGVINALTTRMIRQIRHALDEAIEKDRYQFILLLGAGNRGFCAGGDLRRLAKAVKEKSFPVADEFFQEEYALDLYIHQFPKPVIVIADGVTMGGGLGLSAGASVVIATERTLMAMPETRIGFFPDVGSTGWMFKKCPRGYPEYLGLVGYEMEGAECIRLGLADSLTKRRQLPRLRKTLQTFPGKLPEEKTRAVQHLKFYLVSFFQKDIPVNPEMDEWVAAHFSGKTSIREIMNSLSQCSREDRLCQDVYHRLSERSPTALVLTLTLLRHNERRPLEEVFEAETRAARFIIRHPDYLEGIRARILDKDDQPHWQPSTVEEATLPELGL